MKKGFLDQTWQKIVGSIVGLILVGAASFVGASLKSTMDKVDKHDTDIVVVQKDVQNMSGTLGSSAADVETLKLQVTRLQTIVDRLEKVTK